MVHDDIYEYNSLFDEDPEIQAMVAKGKIEVAQQLLNEIAKFRFPLLVEVIQQRTASIQNVDMLSQLAKQIAVAKDEQTARWVLDTYAAA